MSDRAAVVARAIMQMVVAAPRGGTDLEEAIAAYLRDEFSDIEQQTISNSS